MYVNANSKENCEEKKSFCEEKSFPLFQKNTDAIFVPDLRPRISKKCVSTPIFFVDSNSPC